MPASADSSQKLNHDAIAMARFFSGLLDEVSKILGLTGKPEGFEGRELSGIAKQSMEQARGGVDVDLSYGL
jgi:hypothetical protein